MIRTILITGLLIAAGILSPSVSLPVWGLALCVLVWGLKDTIPYPEDDNSEYVQRYFKAREDARLYTRAMLHQGYLHKEEIRHLNEMITPKK